MKAECEILTSREAAQFLRIACTTLEHYRATGVGPPFTPIGTRLVRYRLSALMQWMERREQGLK